MPAYPKAAPPSRVVRGEELQDLFRAVKGAFHNLVSSSCTSGKNGTRGGRWEPARPPPRNHSSSLKGSGRGGLFFFTRARHSRRPGKHSRHLWVWLGQRYHTRRGQRSRVVIPGERELALRCSDRHLVVRGSTEGNRRCTPFCRGPSPLQRQPHRLRSAWGVRNSSWEALTVTLNHLSAPPRVPGRTLNRGRGRGTPPCLTQRSLYATPRWSCPPFFLFFFSFEEEHEPSTKASSACWMPRHVRQRSWPSWAPGNDHTQKRTGDKTSLKRRDHPWYSFREIALSEKCSFSAEARRGAGSRKMISRTTWPPLLCRNARRTLSVEGESSSFNHYRLAPKRKDELMRCTCCLLYSRGDQRQLDAMIACQCPLARWVTLEVDRSLWRDPNFVVIRRDSEWPTEREQSHFRWQKGE